MSLKSSLPKWIYLSCAKHFDSNISGLTTFVEGFEERDLSGESSWVEIRIDGPDIREVSKDTYIIESEINLLVATHFSPIAPSDHAVNVGKAVAAFTDFNVYKYGNTAEDTGASLEIFRLKPLADNSDRIRVANMGQIDPQLKLLQTTVSGQFRMVYSE